MSPPAAMGAEPARQTGLQGKSSSSHPSTEFQLGKYKSFSASPVKSIRYPRFATPEAEREFRKLHHAAALRWLGTNGYNNEGAGGHVTVRDPIFPDTFWINPHGKSFSHMMPEDLVLVDEHGQILEGGNMHAINPAGYVIHSAVHKARPDVVAVVHCHSVPSKAFSALGCKLEPINQDACRYVSTTQQLPVYIIPLTRYNRFYEDHGLYAGFGGIAVDPEEGEHIVAALGSTKAVILQNHGILTVAKSVDGAAFLFGAMDRCIQAQLLADAASAGRGIQTIKIDRAEAEYTRNNYNDEMTYIMFQSAYVSFSFILDPVNVS